MVWRVLIGVALLLWVLGVAYYQARRRGRRMEPALFLLVVAGISFLAGAFWPRPPMPVQVAGFLTVASVILLALSLIVALARGFHA